MVNSLINREVIVPNNNFEFSVSRSETRQLNDISEYQDISARPLFDQDRKLEEKVVAKKIMQKKVVEKQLMVQALGIAITGEKLLAVVKNLSNGKILRLRINEEIEGWTLISVSAEKFVFTKSEAEKVVKFRNNGE